MTEKESAFLLSGDQAHSVEMHIAFCAIQEQSPPPLDVRKQNIILNIDNSYLLMYRCILTKNPTIFLSSFGRDLDTWIDLMGKSHK